MPVLQQALGQQQNPQPASSGGDVLGELMSEFQRLKAATPKPMFTPEQVQQRQADNGAQVDVGLLGALSGDRNIAQTGGGVLTQALKARQPVHTARGQFDPMTGEMAVDPSYQQAQIDQQKGKVLQQALQWQNHRAQAEERASLADTNNQFRAQQAEEGRALRMTLGQMALEARKARGAGSGTPKLRMVKTADGGYEFVPVEAGPVLLADGTPAKAPPTGTGSGKDAMPSGLQGKFIQNMGTQAEIQNALKFVRSTPGAFGLQNMLPDSITQRMGGDKGAAGVQARASVANIGSRVIHDRSGATVTIAEMPRLKPFIPGPTDSPETIENKLIALDREVNIINDMFAQGYPMSALVKNLRGTPAPGAGAGAPQAPGAQPAPGAVPAQPPVAPGGAPAGKPRFTYLGSE